MREQLREHMMSWKRFVDDTITSIKPTSIPDVINVLNSFLHSNIEFTYEEEKDGQIPILDVLVRKDDTFETTEHRKPTNNGIICTAIRFHQTRGNVEL